MGFSISGIKVGFKLNHVGECRKQNGVVSDKPLVDHVSCKVCVQTQ